MKIWIHKRVGCHGGKMKMKSKENPWNCWIYIFFCCFIFIYLSINAILHNFLAHFLIFPKNYFTGNYKYQFLGFWLMNLGRSKVVVFCCKSFIHFLYVWRFFFKYFVFSWFFYFSLTFKKFFSVLFLIKNEFLIPIYLDFN